MKSEWQPNVSVRHADAGAMEVLIDDWVYVRVNYDYRYTDNASRAWLAMEIKKLISPGDLVAVPPLVEPNTQKKDQPE